MKKIISGTVILICSSTLTIAETQFRLSPSLLHFDYTEFNTSNTELDRERGWLPGIELELTQSFLSDWRISLSGSYYQGTVDYNGQTQSGTPHLTQTDTVLLRLAARIEKTVMDNTNLFIATQAHRWRRDIRDNNNISGILETYKWLEFSAGFNYAYRINPDNQLNLEIAYLVTRNATIDVDLSRNNLGTTMLNIGDGSGGRISLNWKTSYTDNAHIGLTLFFEAWNFGRSNTKPTQGGTSTVFVTEPKSKTRNTGLQLNIEYSF